MSNPVQDNYNAMFMRIGVKIAIFIFAVIAILWLMDREECQGYAPILILALISLVILLYMI
jgi:hypothetical protein